MLSGIDHVVGRVAAALEKEGLAENTIVIYTGDNGYYMGQRGFAGKWSHYEESLRVPLIIHDPRGDLKPQVRDEVVLNIDLASTFVAAAGIDLPEQYQGRELNTLVAGRQVNSWRQDFFCEHLFHVPGRIPKWEGVRGQR
jgi:arylsulfatase A-like enzyme